MKTSAHGVILLHIFLTQVWAMQPGAVDPIPAPLRPLKFGDLNILHTTDTHGWHAGHLLEESFGADWGDYVSFTTRMREQLEAAGQELLVVDSGDRVEGSGLYDSSDPRGKYTFDIFKAQAMDLICIGNHELYKNTSAEDDHTKLVPHYGENYIATNLFIQNPKTSQFVPFANRSRTFTTKKTGIRILAFGFIFDFTRNDKNTKVIPVEDVVRDPLFINTVREAEVDLIMVIGHVALRSFEFEIVHKAIRDAKNDRIPILFLGGHYHVRDYRIFDDRAHALASGRFLETIGFASIDGLQPNSTNEDITFSRRYIDNNLFSFYNHSNTTSNTFDTPLGLNVSKAISNARTELDLDQTFGCAVQDYWMSRAPYPRNDSIFSLLTDKIFPDIINEERKDKTRLILTNTGAIRFDIFKGKFTRDSTFIVSPFTSELQYIQDVPYGLAKKLLPILNDGDPQTLQIMQLITMTNKWKFDLLALPPPEQQHANALKDTGPSNLYVQRYKEADTEALSSVPTRDNQQPLQLATDESSSDSDNPLTPGYTTVDDAGKDGDDTLHTPIKFYQVPNCIQAIFPADGSNISKTVDEHTSQQDNVDRVDPTDSEPVDLLFNAFLRPYILSLLNLLQHVPTSEESDTIPELWSYPDYVTAMQWMSVPRMSWSVMRGENEGMPPPEEGVKMWEMQGEQFIREYGLKEIDEADKVVKKNYTNVDVLNYVPGETFTTILAGWIKKNWAGNCPDGTNLV